MKALQAIAIVCLLFFPFSARAAIDAPFDRLQDNAWALVLTGPADAPLYVEQMALLEPQAEKLKQREVVVIHFHGRTLKTYPELSVYDYSLPSLKGSKKGKSSHRKIKMLEGQLQTDDDVFSVVLVNKDGATQYVWNMVVKPKDIFQMMDHPVPMAPQPAVPDGEAGKQTRNPGKLERK